MPRNRVLLLLKRWHFADNCLDDDSNRLYKLQPFIDQLLLNFKEHMILAESLVIHESMVPVYGRLKFRQNFKEHMILAESLVIHESMVPVYGRLKFRQYIKNKSSQYGIKLYKLCTTSAYTLSLKVYVGKGDSTPGKSHAGSIVDYLLSEYSV
ncbi:Transposase IS4 [Popillia japonica]|uniref:Transposase IS4 n=1 Tax=Popillia japonica TaxID=7064 RepID=A0AAW1K2Z8_POPJA